MTQPHPLGPATQPGPDATLPPRHPDAPPPGTAIASHYRWCYSCGEDHPCGLHMQVVAGEGITLRSQFEVTDQHQGAPGLAHGGVLSTAMDEALGALGWLLRMPSVTARLEVDFVRPVPVGTHLHISARITGIQGRKIYSTGEATAGPDGPVMVRASALYLGVPIEHFRKNGRAEDVARASAARRDSTAPEINP